MKGDEARMGGVPYRGGDCPKELFNASASAEGPGPGKESEPSAPGKRAGKSVGVPTSVWFKAGTCRIKGLPTLGTLGTGEVNRAIDVARLSESATSDLPRDCGERERTGLGWEAWSSEAISTSSDSLR